MAISIILGSVKVTTILLENGAVLAIINFLLLVII